MICIGTASFITGYGIVNKQNIDTYKACKKLVSRCLDTGFNIFDTAIAYGSSEKWLMRVQNETNADMVVSSKISPKTPSEGIDRIIQEYKHQSTRLRFKTLYSHSIDGFTENSDLMRALREAKEQGLAMEVGASLYPDEIEKFKPIAHIIDRIQVPLSIYDRRILANEWQDLIQKWNIKVSARSIFMQGLALTKPEKWPEQINPSLKLLHESVTSVAKQDSVDMYDLCMSVDCYLDQIDEMVIGINTLGEVDRLLKWTKSDIRIEPSNYVDQQIAADGVDPRSWAR